MLSRFTTINSESTHTFYGKGNLDLLKNKALADETLDNDELWLSETPIGQADSRGNFVKRDRIQSGLSLAVCPVQTPLENGTQYTIEFSRKQGRFLFTPIPLEQDKFENGVTILKDTSSYESIHNILLDYKTKLEITHTERFEKFPAVLEGIEEDSEQLGLFD